VEAGGLELGDPVDSSEIALRNWTTEELSALDCSTLPVTGREDLFCHEDFFGYLGVIVGEGGCSFAMANPASCADSLRALPGLLDSKASSSILRTVFSALPFMLLPLP